MFDVPIPFEAFDIQVTILYMTIQYFVNRNRRSEPGAKRKKIMKLFEDR